jgi:hypothetical protein
MAAPACVRCRACLPACFPPTSARAAWSLWAARPHTGPHAAGAVERPSASAALVGTEPPAPPHPWAASSNDASTRVVVELCSRGRPSSELEPCRSRLGAELDLNSPTCFPIRWESQILSRSSAKSSISQHDAGADASGFLVSARWLLKPPRPLVMKTQEPKVVLPSSSTALVELNDAIELSCGSSMSTPT